MQFGALKTLRHWPIWRQITLALLGAMVLISFVTGEAVRKLETTYLQDSLHKQSEKTLALLSRLPLRPSLLYL